MIKTGQILKEAREKKGISIAEVSLSTKINSKILNAMEQGNLSKLPPKTFLRGFVLSYAQYLQLDTDMVMKSFQEEMGASRQANEPEAPTLAASAPTAERAPQKGLPRASSSFAKAGAVVGIILLVMIILMVKSKMDSYESETVPNTETVVVTATPSPEATPSENQTSTAESDSSGGTPSDQNATAVPVVVASPTPTPTATPTATPVATATPTPKPTATATPIPSPTATPTPKPSATPTPSATPKPSPSPTSTPKPSPSPTATPAPTGKLQDITIEALDDVDITAVIDGETRSIRLNADQVHTIKAKRKVSLQLSDGGAVSIIVNGIDRGVPGDLGKPKKVDLP